jgi:hypothetical protein
LIPRHCGKRSTTRFALEGCVGAAFKHRAALLPRAMKLVAFVLMLTVVATFAPAHAEARPQCLQVYPWSELCEGDLGGFFGGVCIRGAGQVICPLVCLDPRGVCLLP